VAEGYPPTRDRADDFYESSFNWPLLYLLGGGDHLLTLAHRQWEAITRRLSAFGLLHQEYERGYDQFHQQERMGRGDVVVDLGVTSLVANAYLLTGEEKYRRWVLVAKGGRVIRNAGSIVVEGARAATLLVAAATSYGGEDPASRCARDLSLAAILQRQHGRVGEGRASV
jgi:hypothetical protein